MSAPIDPVYLPYDEATLRGHFAKVKGEGEATRDRRVNYYLASARRAANLRNNDKPTPADIRAGRQMEKDERFWIAAALMTLFHDQTHGGPRELFASVLHNAGVAAPPGGWAQALAGDLDLCFEANLPSPPAYRDWLVKNPDRQAAIPYLRKAARDAGKRVEGRTWMDAILVARQSGTAVVFEAKVLSDVSTHISYDATRNQLARIIDVVLDENPQLQAPLNMRKPDRTYVVLVTPELLSPDGPKGADRSRLYGWLIPEYKKPDSTLLARHLEHRQGNLGSIHERLGWVTWEQINQVRPGACSWLDTPAKVEQAALTQSGDSPATA